MDLHAGSIGDGCGYTIGAVSLCECALSVGAVSFWSLCVAVLLVSVS